MSNNRKENNDKVESLDIFLCVRRKKENPDRPEIMFRQIIRNYEEDLRTCKERINNGKPGDVWRIYKTVNSRDVKKAAKLMMYKMIEEGLEGFPNAHRLDSLWKTCLLQPACRFEKYFLIDCDSAVAFSQWIEFVTKYNDKEIKPLIHTEKVVTTPNGYHIITNGFNKTLCDIDNLTILSDGFVFIEKIEVK